MARRHTARKARTHRRRHQKTHHRRHPQKRKQKGGGKLDRLPLAANASITPPIQLQLYLFSGPINTLNDEKKMLILERNNQLRNPSATSEKLEELGAAIKAIDMKIAFLNAQLLSRHGALLQSIEDEFKAEWDFQMILGHGELLPEAPTQVPPNTYVMFNSPAGCIAISMGSFPIGERTLAKVPGDMVASKDRFISEIAIDHVLQQAFFDTTTPAIRQTLLAASNVYSDPFFENKGHLGRSTISPHLVSEQTKRTIYEPGEDIPNMSLNFSNNLGQQLVLGTYDLPIDNDFRTTLEDAYIKVADDAYRSARAAGFQRVQNAEKIMKSAVETTHKMDQENFGVGNKYGYNLTPGVIGTTKSLSELFALLPPVPAGKKRFLFIPACRGLEQALPDPAYANLARRVRRASLAASTPGTPNTLANFSARYQAEHGKIFRTLGSAAPAAAVDSKQRMREIVKGMLGDKAFNSQIRSSTPKERANAKAEITRQRSGVAGGIKPGTNDAFAGGPYEV